MAHQCAGPSGAFLGTCARPATCHLAFSCEFASGGWYVCDMCCLRTVMWLEDQYERDRPTFKREAIDGSQAA